MRAELGRGSTSMTGVDVGASLNLVGVLVLYLSPAVLVPAALAVGYSEPVWPFLASGAIAAAVGWAMTALTRGTEQVSIREGFLVVSLVWLAAAGFGALPYEFSSVEPLNRPVDAYFEAMSGFTTTGSTVVADPEELPRSLLMWRQLTQWLGGMGIIVLFLAVLPRLRVGGRQLLESEARLRHRHGGKQAPDDEKHRARAGTSHEACPVARNRGACAASCRSRMS